jgi:hypothetical protein
MNPLHRSGYDRSIALSLHRSISPETASPALPTRDPSSPFLTLPHPSSPFISEIVLPGRSYECLVEVVWEETSLQEGSIALVKGTVSSRPRHPMRNSPVYVIALATSEVGRWREGLLVVAPGELEGVLVLEEVVLQEILPCHPDPAQASAPGVAATVGAAGPWLAMLGSVGA